MPLARLSIKSATIIAQQSVTLRRARRASDLWLVITKFRGEETISIPMPRVTAKVARRERRVFLALMLLDIDRTAAAVVAAVASAADKRDWRRVVAGIVERFLLCGS